MSKKIGIENFRVFKEYTEFEIKPITLLTGPNNSGKSSLTKFLLLLQNGMESLSFDEESPNLESFDNVLNTTSKAIEVKLGNSISTLNEEFQTTFSYSRIHAQPEIKISKGKNNLFTFSFNKHETKDIFDRGTAYLNFNISFIIELLLSKEFIVSGYYYGPPPDFEDEPEEFYGLAPYSTSLKEIEQHINAPIDLNLKTLRSNLNSFWERESDSHDVTGEDWRNQALQIEIDTLDKNSCLLYDIYIDDKNITTDYYKKAIEIQEEIFSNLSFNIGISNEFENFKALIVYAFQHAPLKFENEFKRKLQAIVNIESINIKPNRLAEILFSEKMFSHKFHLLDENGWSKDLFNYSYYKKTFFETLSNISFDSKVYLNNMRYISPQRGSQKRVLMNKSENEIDSIIVQYSKLHETDKNIVFLQQALDILQIEGKLEIERFENYVSTVHLNQINGRMSLSDLGYGYSQIIPVILKIIIIANNTSESNIILEEPEANLHPDLQSKVAEIISLCIHEFPYLNFIIETHSEYFIRKLQFLTAKKELSIDDSVIYYFNSDRHVNVHEPKVKRIEITETGNLTDNFGPGFYDEATRLQFELMKINQEQNN